MEGKERNDVSSFTNNNNSTNNIMRERRVRSVKTSSHRNSLQIEDEGTEIFSKLGQMGSPKPTHHPLEFIRIHENKESKKEENEKKEEKLEEEVKKEKEEKEEKKEKKEEDFLRFYIIIGVIIVYCWFIGFFGLGLIFLLVTVPVGGYIMGELTEISIRRAIDEQNKLPANVKKGEFEKASWLNNVISHLWLSFPDQICSSLSHALSERLSHSKPFFIKEVTLAEFSIGENFPRVRVMKSYSTNQSCAHLRSNNQINLLDDLTNQIKEQNFDIPLETLDKHIQLKDEDEIDPIAETPKYGETMITVDFQLNSKTDIQFTCNATIIGVPATFPFLVSDISLDAMVRLTLKITQSSPFVEFIRISVLEEPTLLLSIQPLKNNSAQPINPLPNPPPHTDIRSQLKQKILNVTKNVKVPDLMQIPLVSQWLNDTFVLVLKKSMRYPNYLQINMNDLTPHFTEILKPSE